MPIDRDLFTRLRFNWRLPPVGVPRQYDDGVHIPVLLPGETVGASFDTALHVFDGQPVDLPLGPLVGPGPEPDDARRRRRWRLVGWWWSALKASGPPPVWPARLPSPEEPAR